LRRSALPRAWRSWRGSWRNKAIAPYQPGFKDL
jgi:hypothetical protein